MNRLKYVLLAMVVAAGLVVPAFAQQADQQAKTPPLVQLLQSKGILTAAEAAQITQATSAAEANDRLAQVLLAKGLITESDYNSTVGPLVNDATSNDVNGGHFMNSVVHVGGRNSAPTPVTSDMFTYGAPGEAGGVIPAVAPVRVLPIDIPKQGSLIPDITLGSGARMKLYGFFKASAVENSTNSGGATFGSDDFPLPLLLQNGAVSGTGPNAGANFHIKARSARFGSQFEWVPKNSDLVITGRLEADFEGDYEMANNRNISSVRSNMLSLRLAYIRLDTKLADIPVYMEFGQDWTLLGSSTLPNIFETTGLMVGLGDLYERAPQIKVGAQFGSGDFKVEPDFAIQLPVSADSTLTTDQRLREGDIAGPDSNQPAVEARLVFQFPLNKSWQGVAPAQLIVSGHHARIEEIIPGVAETAASSTLPAIGLPNTNVPGATGCTVALALGECSVFGFFPQGVDFDYPQNIFTLEAQLPTPWVTAVAKWYKGSDLRFFFGGQVNSAFTTPGVGFVNPGAGSSLSGVSIDFSCVAGVAPDVCAGPITPGQLNPIRGQGGFGQLSFPLGRIFGANPEGRNAGWVFSLLYGTDRTKREDIIQSGGNGLNRTDTGMATLSWKINKWVSFVNEVTYYQTRVAPGFGEGKFFQGIQINPGGIAAAAHDWTNEFGTIVTF